MVLSDISKTNFTLFPHCSFEFLSHFSLVKSVDVNEEFPPDRANRYVDQDEEKVN